MVPRFTAAVDAKTCCCEQSSKNWLNSSGKGLERQKKAANRPPLQETSDFGFLVDGYVGRAGRRPAAD